MITAGICECHFRRQIDTHVTVSEGWHAPAGNTDRSFHMPSTLALPTKACQCLKGNNMTSIPSLTAVSTQVTSEYISGRGLDCTQQFRHSSSSNAPI